MGYRTLPWYGGKRGYGKAEWIASFLPQTPDSCYIEPFAGMAGVLLARQPIKREVVNDLNRRIVNWWQAVRDEPDEFGRLIDAMPASRVEYEWAVRNMDNPELTPIRRALAFHVAVEQSVLHADNTPSVSWSRTFAPQVGFKPRVRAWDISALADRLRYVQLECVDACDLLERVRDCDYAVIYADPPYPTANTSPYAIDTLDIGRCAELLAAQRGAVGVSGYGDEWDMLGWRRVERPGLSRAHTGGGSYRPDGGFMAKRQGIGNAAGAVRVSNYPATATEHFGKPIQSIQ